MHLGIRVAGKSGVLHELDEGALIKILTEPKNALVKQYQKKFDFDKVGDEFRRYILGKRIGTDYL